MLVKAYAKINLTLQVLSRRPDGYHDLATVLQEIGLYDTLRISKRPSGITITCSDPSLPTGRENLIYKAVQALQKAALSRGRRPTGVRIHLQKKIPVGAGLGGGSSDAAAVLKALNRLWRLGFSAKRLAAIGTTIGADVPFFIKGGTAFAQGKGEKLTQWPRIPVLRLILVKPAFGIATSWVYKNVKISLTKRPKNIKIIHYSLKKKNWPQLSRYLSNDLEAVCFREYPLLGEIKQHLLSSGAAAALMSGSGSAIFGLISSKTAGRQFKGVFSRRKGFWIWGGKTLVRD